MINKNIGRSQSDLIRLFENVREELLNLFDQRETIVANSKDDSAIDKLGMLIILMRGCVMCIFFSAIYM